MNEKRYTVLGLGEKYVAPVERRRKGFAPPPPAPRTLQEARALVSQRVTDVLSNVGRMPAVHRLPELVVELRLNERFGAKTYEPTTLLRQTGLTLRGTGTWTQPGPPDHERKSAKQEKRPKGGGDRASEHDPLPLRNRSLFVSGPRSSLEALKGAATSTLSKQADIELVRLDDIRLPAAEDRIRGGFDAQDDQLAVEVVLFDWDDLLLKQAIERVVKMVSGPARGGKAPPRVKSYPNGPTFIAAVTTPALIKELGQCNFLRAARPLGRVSLTKVVTRQAFPAAGVPLQVPIPSAQIAIFDGGYSTGHPMLDPYVEGHDLTKKPPEPDAVEHGTMVASAAVFGPFPANGAIPAPTCRALAYRILPDPDDDHLELYGAIDAIEAQVPKLPKTVQVVNLSFGPRAPIDDDLPSRFTYAIDRLAREHEKLFVTAVGNDGDVAGLERVQAPADSVNNLSVGAYRLNGSASAEHANYSCRGPGRAGGVVKPDVLAFGGCEKRPFLALVPAAGSLGSPVGTSFAAPVVSSLVGRLGALVDGAALTPEALRALLIHTAAEVAPPASELHAGHGRVPSDPAEVLACSARRVSVLYQGVVTPRTTWKLPFLLPPDFEAGGNVRFEWTIVFSPSVEQARPDEYTLAGLLIAFRPHSDIYSFTAPEGSSEKPKKLNIESEAALCEALVAKGWKRSGLPANDSSTYKSEHQLRTQDRKWETVVPGRKGKSAAGISEPMLTIDVLGRGAWDAPDPKFRARYAAVLTVHAPKYNGDLYADILKVHHQLRPLMLKPQTQVPNRLRT